MFPLIGSCYVALAAIGQFILARTAARIPFPNWVWDSRADESGEQIRKAA